MPVAAAAPQLAHTLAERACSGACCSAHLLECCRPMLWPSSWKSVGMSISELVGPVLIQVMQLVVQPTEARPDQKQLLRKGRMSTRRLNLVMSMPMACVKITGVGYAQFQGRSVTQMSGKEGSCALLWVQGQASASLRVSAEHMFCVNNTSRSAAACSRAHLDLVEGISHPAVQLRGAALVHAVVRGRAVGAYDVATVAAGGG